MSDVDVNMDVDVNGEKDTMKETTVLAAAGYEMKLNIHEDIMLKLKYFKDIHKIPHLIFHGHAGVGKKTIVEKFINMIYDNDKEKIKLFVMYINCAHGKGIKFIRDELKFFAKTNINANNGNMFKTIILLNADKLTTDAQSALRRCIELFSHTTRFMVIIEDKYKLLKPILSRFCEIYIPEPCYGGKTINLYKHNHQGTGTGTGTMLKNTKLDTLKKELNGLYQEIEMIGGLSTVSVPLKLIKLSEKLYENGYSGLNILELIENTNNFKFLNDEKRYNLLFNLNKVIKEIRNEKIIIMFILNFLFLEKGNIPSI
jgi:hypothetical protein